MKHTRSISIFTVWLLKLIGNVLAYWVGKDGRICVINYHRVLPVHEPLLASEPDMRTFRWQMELLARCFNVQPLGEALNSMAAGTIPPRAVCITFDDGYRSIHDLALPVLREFQLSATVFVTSGHVDKGNMWNDLIIEAIQVLPDGPLDLRAIGLESYGLHSLEDRRKVIGILTEFSKYLPPEARRDVVDRLTSLAGRQPAPELMLTGDMVRNLEHSGIEIGAHTVSHPILTSLSDEDARAEILNGKHELEALLGKPVRLFAYPNGKQGKDFDHRHIAMVNEAGFDAGFTTAVGAITRDQNPFQLPRSRPWDTTPLMFGLRILRWMAQGPPR